MRFGLEVCYTPETESLLSSILEHYQFDFLIGSVHSVNGYLYDMDAFSKELLWDKMILLLFINPIMTLLKN